MALIFVSHSSRDNDSASRLKTWLNGRGFEMLFLDFDKHAGIPPGADWEKTLYREIQQAEAVIVLLTPNWNESKWCFVEFTQARALGKPIFPVIDGPADVQQIARDIQALDLRNERDAGLERLATQLTRIALDAQGGFAWDSTRPPYPGLAAFDEDDAAIYFGRDDDIRHVIERLNARRTQGGAKLIALLGGSGSGKSSLMRAGVIPRLRRDGRNWIVIPPFRPQLHPLDELASALAVAGGPGVDWRTLRAAMDGGSAAAALNAFARDLRTKAGTNDAQVLIPIDQAEEFFSTADPRETQHFFSLMSDLLAGPTPLMVLLGLRSDYLGQLQGLDRLAAREDFSLGPLPLGRISQIIRGPARVAGLSVDEAFVQQAVRDAEVDDALPLLAFALRQLWERAAGDKHLSLSEYLAMGDAQAQLSPLENAIRRAADDVLAEHRPGPDELQALSEAFVPAMVRVNDQGEYARRPARWDELPPKAYPLLEGLRRARLVIVRGDPRVVEAAHEALLRKWPRLRGWLDDAREFLIGKQQLESDLRDWELAAPADKDAALLTGLKLNRMRSWLAERPQQLTARERLFGQQSIAHAEREHQRSLRRGRLILRGSISAAVVLCAALAIALNQWAAAQRTLDRLAVEMIRVAWIDVGRKQDTDARLATVATKFGVTLDDLLPKTDARPGDAFPTLGSGKTDCKTWLASGFRYLYCSLSQVIGLARLQSIAREPVFLPGGPHDTDFDFDDSRRFGHYNPKFLDWLERNVIPEAIANPFSSVEPAQSKALMCEAYTAQVAPGVHTLVDSHEILLTGRAAFPGFLAAFKDEQQRYLATKSREDYFDPRTGDPQPFDDIKAAYEKSLASDAGDFNQQEAFRALADYLAVVKHDDWYLADEAGGFWMRRSIDGTADQIFRLVRKVSRAFDRSCAAERQTATELP